MRKTIQTTATVGLSSGQSSGTPSPSAAWSSFRSTPRDFSLSQFLQHTYRRTFLTCPQYLPISAGFAIGWPRLHVPQTRLRPGRAYARAPHTLSLSQFLQYTNCRSFLTLLQNPPVPHALLSAGQVSCLPNPPAAWSSFRSTPKFYLLMNFQLTPAKTTWPLRFRDLRYLAKDFAGYHLAHNRGDKRRRA